MNANFRGRFWRGGWWLLLLAALASSPALAGDLRIVGSDLLGTEFAAAVKEFAMHNEVALTLSLEGSRAALRELDSGAADIALLVLRPGEEPPGALFKSYPFAYHIVVVLVPESSPLTQITFRELGEIYGATESTSFNRWGDLGLTGEWTSRAITPQAMSPGTGLATELFRRVVLNDGKLRSVVALQTSLDAVQRKLESEPGGIALAGSAPAAGKNIRVLPVARADRDVAFGPTPQNVHAGDYPLRLPVWLVVRRETGRAQLNFLRFLLGEEMTPRLEHAGLVTLPLQARNQLVFDLEQL